MKSFSIKVKDIHYKWYYIDANNKTLGRLATHIAVILRGKHKPTYTPHMDNGDYIIVINAKKIYVTGNKLKDKFYFHHTGYVGGIKKISLQSMISKNPEQVIKNAVKGMLPKNSLGRIMFSKLKVYPNENHPHRAQNPECLNI